MTTKSRTRLIAAGLALFGSGCVHYEAMPLDVEGIVAHEELARKTDFGDLTSISLVALELHMREKGPTLRRALAAYRRAEARADATEPWPNPAIEFGPVLGIGPDIMGQELVPLGALNLTIPLGDRLESKAELDRVRAAAAGVELDVCRLASYIELVKRFEALALAQERVRLGAAIVTEAERSTALARRMVEAGEGAAIDVALFRLEEGRARLDLNESRLRHAAARAALAEIVGLAPGMIGKLEMSELNTTNISPPPRDDLVELLMYNSGELARCRASYNEAEAELRLAVAEQYPDLHLGFSGADEAGDKKQLFGLSFGIELPIFDRNQKDIAEAEAAREEARENFAVTVAESLSRLDRALIELEIETERLRLISEELLPEAEHNLASAREALRAGAADAMRLLETERQRRRLDLDRLSAEGAWREAWAEIEAVIGRNLRPLRVTENNMAREVREEEQI